MELHAIGTVESPLTDAATAPKQGDEGAPEAWIAFADEVAEALDGIAAGDELLVLTWLDRADRGRPAGAPARRRRAARRPASSRPARRTGRTRSACTG